jgi:glycoprotein endo-alpha-1,2-mannosidase
VTASRRSAAPGVAARTIALLLGLAPALLGLAPALLGWAVWRLERDQPLWVRPGLWSVARPRPAPAVLPRLALAFHYPWYGTPAGPTGRWRHWNHARLALPGDRVLGFHDPRRESVPGRLDLGATHYPAAGPYDSRDPRVMRAQIAAARVAGLDGFVVSWWGRESDEARTFAAFLALARETGFRLAPYYETGELWARGGSGVAADLEALLERHGGDPAWLAVDGTPVIFLYAAHRLRPRVWEYVLRRLAAGGRQAFLIGDAARAGWLERFDALHLYTPVTLLTRGVDLGPAYQRLAAAARAAGRPFMAAVAPGFDDRTIRRPGTLVPRADGATYDATWQAALAVDPAWVLVASWNEWHEGSEIEPSLEHGTRYLETTRRWVEVFRGRPARPVTR